MEFRSQKKIKVQTSELGINYDPKKARKAPKSNKKQQFIIEEASTPQGSHFWVPISDPFLEHKIFFSEERPFLRGPVSGSVLGFVLAPILKRKVFENKAEETREREGS